MSLYASRYRVESARCPGWDYSRPGWYFITFCTHRRRCDLSEIVAAEVRLRAAGRILIEEWERTPLVRPTVELGPYVAMPDHFHALVRLKEGAKAVGGMINQVKSIVTKRIRATVLPDFRWQARYYDHIIRDAEEWERISRYIAANPAAWQARCDDAGSAPLSASEPSWVWDPGAVDRVAGNAAVYGAVADFNGAAVSDCVDVPDRAAVSDCGTVSAKTGVKTNAADKTNDNGTAVKTAAGTAVKTGDKTGNKTGVETPRRGVSTVPVPVPAAVSALKSPAKSSSVASGTVALALLTTLLAVGDFDDGVKRKPVHRGSVPMRFRAQASVGWA